MLKKIFFSLLFTLILTLPAHAAEDYSRMNPTVKIASYKKLFIDQVLHYGNGSGTVISKDGLVVTNHHVVFDEKTFKPLDTFEVCITFDVQKEPVCQYTARLVAHNKDLDLALLKINETDVFGNPLPDLKYLNHKNNATPKEQTEIRVAGYPGSGGKTITITKGQISGFEKFNDYQYFKTDTDFDYGSSGGTALDSDGNFVGVPTYIRSYAENVGYFLDLREARGWLDEQITKSPAADREAEEYLEQELVRFKKANDELSYTQGHYPFAHVELPEGWEFLEINDNSLYASQKNLSNPVGFSLYIGPYPFKIDQGYMDKLEEELEKTKEVFPDYQKEEVVFAGQNAWKITYTSMMNKNTSYYIPYGYAIVGLSYSIDLDEADKQEKAIQPVLDGFDFTRLPVDDPLLIPTLRFDEPPFEITAAGDFRLQKNTDKQNQNLLAEAAQKDNFEGTFAIYYELISKDERHRTAEERLEDIVTNLGGRKLVFKNDDVVLGGLEGFLYTYEYEGRKYQQMRKRMVIQVRNGDYEFDLEYDDLTGTFDDNLPLVRDMLDSFEFKGEASSPIQTSYGVLGFTFNDIQNHRYALAISDLADKDIVKGYGDGGFHPEQLVSRAEALKMILESKNHLETEKNSKKAVDFTAYDSGPIGYRDVYRNNPLFRYIRYATEQDFVSGYPNGSFKPDQSVTLTETLKLLLNVYEIPVWAGETDPWYKKYMDKGFELRLIPYGLYDPGHPLTRAELAYLINTVYKKAK